MKRQRINSREPESPWWHDALGVGLFALAFIVAWAVGAAAL